MVNKLIDGLGWAIFFLGELSLVCEGTRHSYKSNEEYVVRNERGIVWPPRVCAKDAAKWNLCCALLRKSDWVCLASRRHVFYFAVCCTYKEP